jgi:3-keto-disaccharide hydrolase
VRPVRSRAAQRPRRAGLLLLEGGILLILAVTTQPVWGPLLEGEWTVVYDGYGTVSTTSDGATLAPRAPASSAGSDTHAALVVTNQHYEDLTFSADVLTRTQLRPQTPNPWEVGWLLWHQTDPQHFYAVALKPNGWEVSKQVPSAPGGQRFLASGDTPRFAPGSWHHVTVTQRGGDIFVTADGRTLARLTDPDPYTHGAVGLYTEDAVAVFRDLTITNGA